MKFFVSYLFLNLAVSSATFAASSALFADESQHFNDDNFPVSVTKTKRFDIVKTCDEDGLEKLLVEAKDDAAIKATKNCSGTAYRSSVWSIEQACISTIDGKVTVQADFVCAT